MATDRPNGWGNNSAPPTPSEGGETPTAKAPRIGELGSTVLLTLIAAVVIAGYVILQSLNRDTLAYTVFLTGPVVSGIVGAILARRQEQIKRDLSVVKYATNGLLTAQFAAQSAERESNEQARLATADEAASEVERLAHEVKERPTG